MSAITSIVRSLPTPLQGLGEVLAKTLTGPADAARSGPSLGDAIARLRDHRLPSLKNPGGIPTPYSLDSKSFANVKATLPQATANLQTIGDAINQMTPDRARDMTEAMEKLVQAQRDFAGIAYQGMHNAQTKLGEPAQRLRGYGKIGEVMEEAMIAYARGNTDEAKQILQKAKGELDNSGNKYVQGHGHMIYRDLLAGIESGDFKAEFGRHEKNLNNLKIAPRQEIESLGKTIRELHGVANKHLEISTMLERQLRGTIR